MWDSQFMDAHDATEELSGWLHNLTVYAFNPKWSEKNTLTRNYISHERAALYGDIQTAAMGRHDFEMLDGASSTYGRDDLNRPGDALHYTEPLYRQWTSQLLTALCSDECLSAWKRGRPSHNRLL
jgi:hypothetical protein